MSIADQYGFCVCCHENMLVQRVVGGKVEKMFLPDHDHTEFVLNNKSKMVVCMCKSCKSCEDLSDPDKHKDIMESVLAGWQLEQDTLVNEGKQTPEGREKVMNHHKPLNILFHSEGIDDYVISDRLNKLGV